MVKSSAVANKANSTASSSLASLLSSSSSSQQTVQQQLHTSEQSPHSQLLQQQQTLKIRLPVFERLSLNQWMAKCVKCPSKAIRGPSYWILDKIKNKFYRILSKISKIQQIDRFPTQSFDHRTTSNSSLIYI